MFISFLLHMKALLPALQSYKYKLKLETAEEFWFQSWSRGAQQELLNGKEAGVHRAVGGYTSDAIVGDKLTLQFN